MRILLAGLLVATALLSGCSSSCVGTVAKFHEPGFHDEIIGLKLPEGWVYSSDQGLLGVNGPTSMGLMKLTVTSTDNATATFGASNEVDHASQAIRESFQTMGLPAPKLDGYQSARRAC